MGIVAMDDDFQSFITSIEQEIAQQSVLCRTGRIFEITGTLVRASGLDVRIGELCELRDVHERIVQRAEVVGFGRDGALLSPFGPLTGVGQGMQVRATGRELVVPVGSALLGRVVSGLGEPIDGRGPLACTELRPAVAHPPDPMQRAMIDQPMPTGVKIVDALMTLGEGQRMGVFAPAGAGKSTLMGMLARGAQCDVNVIALIGERGREVREFIEFILGPQGMARSVVVCATSDRSAIERAKAAYVATAIAEGFRDRGQRVLLMMDSLTRFARAQREIGLAAGELPARRGFPPSVFAELPRLLERAGTARIGSITALYTVLSEDEGGNDPIAEEVRGILDGHMILSRRIAARHQYPAIDVLSSLSRVMTQIVSRSHSEAAGALRNLMARHAEIEPLLQLGEYVAGSDPITDIAIERADEIRQFLRQETEATMPYKDILAELTKLVR